MYDGTKISFQNSNINDEILVFDNKLHRTVKSKILTYVHKKQSKMEKFEFLKIHTVKGSISISENHLIFCTKKTKGIGQFILAKNVELGDLLMKIENSINKWEQVIKIEIIYDSGIYAPLSTEGTLIVNNFLTSCYASFHSHDIAHLVMLPLINKLKDNEKLRKKEMLDEIDIHPYCKFLIKIKDYLNY